MKDELTAAPKTTDRRPRRHIARWVTIGVVSAAAVTAGALYAAGASGSQSLTVHGTVRNDNSIASGPDGGNIPVPVSATACEDSQRVDVMATVGGRSVQVASGHTAARGHRVTDGYYGDCITSFTIPDVPGGYASYGLRVAGTSSAVSVTAAQLTGSIRLTFGG